MSKDLIIIGHPLTAAELEINDILAAEKRATEAVLDIAICRANNRFEEIDKSVRQWWKDILSARGISTEAGNRHTEDDEDRMFKTKRVNGLIRIIEVTGERDSQDED